MTDFNGKRRAGTYYIYVRSLSDDKEWKLNWQKECNYILGFIANKASCHALP